MNRSVLLLLSLVGCGEPSAPTPDAPAGMAPLSARSIQKDVEYLASDELAGRGTGEVGLEMAAAHIAERYASLGLEPLEGQKGFRVPYALYRLGWNADGTSLSVGDRRFDVGQHFLPFGFSDDYSVKDVPVVFVGYGIQSDEHEWDDYAGIDVEGKLVLMLRHEPNEKDDDSVFGGAAHTDHAAFRTKAVRAFEAGAAGMLLVTDPLNHQAADDFRNGRRLVLDRPEDDEAEAEEEDRPFVAVHVSKAVADAMLEPAGKTLAHLQKTLDAEGPGSFDLGVAASVSAQSLEEAESVEVHNVIGRLPGSDPALADEWVVVGAHYDHLGAYVGKGDTIYNGADDNASGTAGLMAIASEFAALPEPPARTLVFAAFSGEEMGLLGSRQAVRDGVLPAQRTRLMVNLDMIGRNSDDPVELIGDGFATGTREFASKRAAELELPLKLWGDDYKGSSDHDPFVQEGTPAIHLFTGLHDDYHQLSDHSDKVDFEQAAKVAELGFGLAAAAASGELAPAFVHHLGWLGVKIVDAGDGPELVDVEADSRGAKAGLVVGDQFVRFGDETTEEVVSLGQRLSAIEPGTETTIHITRGSQALDFPVARAKTGYLGVWPAGVEDEVRKRFGLGDDQGILLRQVVEGGPAAKAGLLADDVVVAIEGRPVGSGSLSRVLAQIGAGEPVSVDLIRREHRMTMPLTLGERPTR